MRIGLLMPVCWSEMTECMESSFVPPSMHEFPFGGRLAVQLWRLGHEVHVFTLCHHFEGELHSSKNGFHIHMAGRRRRFWTNLFDGQKFEAEQLKRMMSNWPCDIYNAHWCYEFARAVVEANVPHVVTVRDNPWKVFFLFRPKSFRFMRLCLSYYVIWNAKKLSVASPYMVEYLRKCHCVKGEIPIVPNAVPSLDVTSCFKKNTNKVVFVEMATGFSECKNVKNLLRAYSIVKDKLKQDGIEVELRLYGWGYGHSEECEKWAIKKNLAEGVVFRGHMAQHDMHREIAEVADVFVHSSREESFGAVIVEAMYCGLPTIVGKKSGACSWVAGDGMTGLLVDVNNPLDMASAMYKLAMDGELRKKFSEAGRLRAKEVFSIEKVAKQYLEMYERVLS